MGLLRGAQFGCWVSRPKGSLDAGSSQFTGENHGPQLLIVGPEFRRRR